MSRDTRPDPARRDELASRRRALALANLATFQKGPVAHRQLLSLGFSESAIGRMLREGRLHPLMRGVYLVGHGALHPRAWWMAATLAGGEGAVLSHRPAGALRDLVRVPAGRIDVTVPGSRGRGHRDLRVHTRALLPPDRDVIDGIPCTSLARTLLDLASVLGHDPLVEAIEQSVRVRQFDLAAVAELLDRSRGHRGTRRLNRALAQVNDDPDVLRSELERRLRALLASSSLPPAAVNRHVRGASGHLYEVDFQWPAARLIVETDGAAYHSSRAAAERDARKQASLEAAGWRVLRLTWAGVVHRPDETVATIAAALRARDAS